MKRIFLTSGIVLCMACPAFAAPNQAGQSWDGATSGQQNGGCDQPDLGVYHGATTLQAQWGDDFALMKLDNNYGINSTDAGGTTDNAGAHTTTDLYITGLTVATAGSEAGKVIYKKDTLTNNFTVAAQGDVVVSAPTGDTVTYTVSTALPDGGTGTPTVINASNPARPFRGYFAESATYATADSAAYIDKDGKVTASGVDASYDNAHPWKALYGAVTPQLDGTPTVYGYSFQGWSINGSSTLKSTLDVNDPTKTTITTDGTATAVWQANTYSVTYSCGTNVAGTAPVTIGDNALYSGTITYDQQFVWAGNDDTGTNPTGCNIPGKHFTGWHCTVPAANTTNNTALEFDITSGCDANATAPQSCNTVTVAKWNSTVQSTLANGAQISCTATFDNNTIGTITWSPNGGTIPTGENTYAGDTSCTYGGNVELPTTPTRTGYTFQGWKVVQ